MSTPATPPGALAHVELEALSPGTRTLANVLRQAFSSPNEGVRLLSGVSVNAGQLPAPTGAWGHVSINGGPAILVPALKEAIPYYNDGGPGWQSYPGVTIYLLATEGQLLAFGYVPYDETTALELEPEGGETDADDT